jgi:hypothetical protein
MTTLEEGGIGVRSGGTCAMVDKSKRVQGVYREEPDLASEPDISGLTYATLSLCPGRGLSVCVDHSWLQSIQYSLILIIRAYSVYLLPNHCTLRSVLSVRLPRVLFSALELYLCRAEHSQSCMDGDAIN